MVWPHGRIRHPFYSLEQQSNTARPIKLSIYPYESIRFIDYWFFEITFRSSFFLVKVLYKNANYTNIFFPQEANLLISRIWNGMTRLQEETDPKKAPFESFLRTWMLMSVNWHNPTLQCVSTTTKNQWEWTEGFYLGMAKKLVQLEIHRALS